MARHSFGVTPARPPAQPLAPTDLRTVPLPPQWATMTELFLQKGNTEYLPDLPATLESLHVEKNRLVELPAFPGSLRRVFVNFNHVATLPQLNAGLHQLNVSHNELSTLPAIPASLRTLNLTDNNFTTLPSLRATSLTSLAIGKNQLTVLPELPPSLRDLRCDSNQISELPQLPNGVTALICSRNPLQKIYIENLTGLEVVVCNHCQLTDLPLLPPPTNPNSENFRQYYFDDNPLSADFAALYQTYRTTPTRPGKNAEFRRAIQGIYIQRRQASAKTLQVALKTGPYGPGAPAAQQAMFGNYNPLNIVGQFLTGAPGTIEMQRLALMEQKEAAGLLPPGTAQRKRERLANIAISGGPMAARAKLYVKAANIAAAKARQAAAAAAAAEAARNPYNVALNAGPLPFGPNEANFQGGKRRTHRKRKHSRGTRKH